MPTIKLAKAATAEEIPAAKYPQPNLALVPNVPAQPVPTMIGERKKRIAHATQISPVRKEKNAPTFPPKKPVMVATIPKNAAISNKTNQAIIAP